VALLLQQRPRLSPAQVKALLTSTARPLLRAHPAMGHGETSARRAARSPLPLSLSLWPSSSGTGSLEASRGGAHVVDPANGTVLSGEVDILGSEWRPRSWARQSELGTAWSGGSWNGKPWTGSGFGPSGSWDAVAWPGTTWGGVCWCDHRTDATWEARSWRDQGWEARSWRGDSWSARSWRSLY
jgi:serine protease AprX